MKKLLILAALVTVSAGQPAFAQTGSANATVLVQHSDLDLRTEAGTKALDRRIWRAAVDVCGSASDFDLEGKNNVRECRLETRLIAKARADVVIADASHGQAIQISSARK
jgi:UrcA family protein